MLTFLPRAVSYRELATSTSNPQAWTAAGHFWRRRTRLGGTLREVARVLFVCLGNICRSPLAEGILRRQAAERGIAIEVDSAGTGDWHVGDLPDHRAIQIGRQRGCDMRMRARQVRAKDFQEFDLIVALDQMNLRDLQRWPGAIPDKVRLARSFDPAAEHLDVPDPYYGTIEDFEEVADMLELACAGILEHVAEE